MNIKARALEVQASNGEIIIVHEPRMQDLGTFLRALPSLTAIAAATKGIQQSGQGVMGVPVDIPDAALEGVFPLFAIMCNISVDDFKQLPLWDGIAVLSAFAEFVPNQAPAPEK